jgi:molecular chaperone DnaJ
MSDLYEILGVSRDASPDQIHNAYRKLALKYHPDQNAGDASATESFKKINNAYDILSDPIKKSQYDRTSFNFRTKSRSRSEATPNPNYSYENVMADFFGGSAYKGRNITVRIEIELKEVFTGCKKHIKIKKKKRCYGCDGRGYTGFTPCTACSGSGSVQVADAPFQFLTQCQVCQGTGKVSFVKCGDCLGTCFLPGFHEKQLEVVIPKGIENGMQIRLAGEGEESVRGSSVDGRTGDVMVFVIVKDHPIFTRQGNDLHAEVPVSYTQLVLGSEIEIPTLSSEIIKVKIPQGSQSHTKFRLKGKGLPFGSNHGDLIATVKIETPKSLAENYEEALRLLAELEKSNITPRREQWAKNIASESK